MHPLVDGHNALFALNIRGRNHEEARHRLLARVAHASSRAIVFFDARNAPADMGRTFAECGVKVVYCNSTTADNEILDIVRNSDRPRQLLVVSNDRHLCGTAAQLGAKTAAVREFLKPLPPDDEDDEEKPRPRGYSAEDFGLPDVIDLG